MIMRSKIIVSIAFLCMFFLTGSASAAVDFPADEAGISAYVKAKDNISLDQAKLAFASIERETADYIIGTVSLPWHTEDQYPHVYVSKDGWIVAYYPKGRELSWLIPWDSYSGGPISSTTLSKAIGITAAAVGGSTTGYKYYDFSHPEATKMMMIVEFDVGSFKLTIPSNYTMYAEDYSFYEVSCYKCAGYAYVDGALFTSAGSGGRTWGSLLGQLPNGVEHTIQLTGSYPRLVLVLEYAE